MSVFKSICFAVHLKNKLRNIRNQPFPVQSWYEEPLKLIKIHSKTYVG